MKLSLGRIAEFTGATGDFDTTTVAVGYSIDSRTIAPEELFFAVKGERLDGHDFVEQALAAGVAAAVVLFVIGLLISLFFVLLMRVTRR